MLLIFLNKILVNLLIKTKTFYWLFYIFKKEMNMLLLVLIKFNYYLFIYYTVIIDYQSLLKKILSFMKRHLFKFLEERFKKFLGFFWKFAWCVLMRFLNVIRSIPKFFFIFFRLIFRLGIFEWMIISIHKFLIRTKFQFWTPVHFFKFLL